MRPVFYLYLFIPLTFACIKDNSLEQTTSGYQGIYWDEAKLNVFEQTAPKNFENTGKLAYYRDFLFLVDKNTGIHIVDIRDTSMPKRISFLEIPAVLDLVIKDNILYCDNGPHLLVLDISDISQIKLIQKIKNSFENQNIAPINRGWFECYDENKGWLVDWEYTLLTDPKCKL